MSTTKRHENKSLAANLFSNSIGNYLFTAIVAISFWYFIVSPVILSIFTFFTDIEEPFYLFLIEKIVSSGLVVIYVYYDWKEIVPPMVFKQILIFGKPTKIWVNAMDPVFLPFKGILFKFEDAEKQSKERDKIEVGPIDFNDKTGKKLKGFVTGIWAVGPDDADRENFRLMKGDQIERDLKTYLERTFIRKFAAKNYEEEIRGNEHLVLTAGELKVYGVIFEEVDPVVVSGNMDTDDYNAQYDRLFSIKKARYPEGHKLTPADLAELDDQIETQLGKAKKVINRGGGNTIWKADVYE